MKRPLYKLGDILNHYDGDGNLEVLEVIGAATDGSFRQKRWLTYDVERSDGRVFVVTEAKLFVVNMEELLAI